MTNKILFVIIILIGVVLAWMWIGSPKVGATAVPKITWCHVEPNGNQQTLELPSQALQNAGHMDANGNPLHAGDHIGACVEPTVTPTTQPTPTPTVEITPTPTDEPECEEDCQEVTPTPIDECEEKCEEVTPTPTPTETPKDEPKGDSNGDPKESHPQAPASATCNIPFDAPDVWYTKENGSAQFRWSTSVQGIEKFSIVYGKTPDNLEWGVDNLPPDSRSLQIDGLTGTTWFQVWSWRGQCAEKSVIIDP